MELERDRSVDVAASSHRAYCATDIWHHSSKLTRQFVQGWEANLDADTRAREEALLVQITGLDVVADLSGLSADDWLRRYALEASLMKIFRGGEIFRQGRGGQKWLLQGDANTVYFEVIANGRRRRCTILCISDGDNLVEYPDEIRSHIYTFYKELFLAAPRSGVLLIVKF
ncbi:hypothetical protein D1007_60497 [Hordeum vulgare]|nr:hypothetical protein D1007_60497 [Hordeum vulgare]